jgi:hypothetical protein
MSVITAAYSAPNRRSAAAGIVTGGIVLGVVDAICAVGINIVFFGQRSFGQTWHAVAYALLGPAALTGGTGTTIVGLAMHFVVAFTWVTAYWIADEYFGNLHRAASARFGIATVGAPLGAVIWLIMNFVVFPMTRLHAGSITSPQFRVFLIQHVVVVGPVIVWAIRRSRGPVGDTPQ